MDKMNQRSRSIHVADRYAYRVVYSDEDRQFVGTCEEFPSLSWLGEDSANALSGIRRVVRDVVNNMTATGATLPVARSRASNP